MGIEPLTADLTVEHFTIALRYHSNSNAYTQNSYKILQVKTLVHRSLKYFSIWKLFRSVIQRFQKALVNKNHPLFEVDSIIKNTLDRHVGEPATQVKTTRSKTAVQIELPADI